MRVFECVYLSVCIRVCIRRVYSMRVFECVYLSVCTRVCVFECVFDACIRVCVSKCVYSSVCIRVCVFECVYSSMYSSVVAFLILKISTVLAEDWQGAGSC